MRILQLIDTLNPGGAERMAVNLANSFDELGIANVLVVSRLDGLLSGLVRQQESLAFLGKKNSFDLSAFQKLKKIVSDFKPDIIHAHGTSIYWGVGLKFLMPRLKLIWHDHLGVSEDVVKNNPRKELDWMKSRIDFVITADESTSNYWLHRKLKSSDQIKYLSNFPHLTLEKKQVSEKYRFLHLANYRQEKGHFHILDAVKRLKSRNISFHVRMVGVAIEPDWKRQVEEAVAKEELDEWITVDGPTSDTSRVLAEADAGLVASDREGLPVALLEYGLAGLPVISTKVGQCSKVLEDGEYGILIEKGDSEALSKAMLNLIQEPEKGEVKGACFKTHVADSYGFREFFKGYQEILMNLGIEQTSND